MSTLVVSLTVEQLEQLVDRAVGKAISSRPEESDVITREEAAAMLKVTPKVVLKYIEKDGLPTLRKLGHEWRFSRTQVIEWMHAKDKT